MAAQQTFRTRPSHSHQLLSRRLLCSPGGLQSRGTRCSFSLLLLHCIRTHTRMRETFASPIAYCLSVPCWRAARWLSAAQSAAAAAACHRTRRVLCPLCLVPRASRLPPAACALTSAGVFCRHCCCSRLWFHCSLGASHSLAACNRDWNLKSTHSIWSTFMFTNRVVSYLASPTLASRVLPNRRSVQCAMCERRVGRVSVEIRKNDRPQVRAAASAHRAHVQLRAERNSGARAAIESSELRAKR